MIAFRFHGLLPVVRAVVTLAALTISSIKANEIPSYQKEVMQDLLFHLSSKAEATMSEKSRLSQKELDGQTLDPTYLVFGGQFQTETGIKDFASVGASTGIDLHYRVIE